METKRLRTHVEAIHPPSFGNFKTATPWISKSGLFFSTGTRDWMRRNQRSRTNDGLSLEVLCLQMDFPHHCINLPIIVPSRKVAGTAILSLYLELDTHSAIQVMYALSPINMRFILNDDSIVSDCTWLRGVPCNVRVAGKIVLLTDTVRIP